MQIPPTADLYRRRYRNGSAEPQRHRLRFSRAVKDTVKALKVNGVAPSEATVKDGSYKIQRPFVFVTKDGTELSQTAQKFFDYATSKEAAEIISKAGAVPAA